MPKTAELANHIIELVAEELDVPKESILSKSRKAEIVDARHMAIKLLHSKDIYPKRIAEVFGITTRSVHYIISNFDNRIGVNKSLKLSYEALKRKINL